MADTTKKLWQIFDSGGTRVFSGTGDTISYAFEANTASGDAEYEVFYIDRDCELRRSVFVAGTPNCSAYPSQFIIGASDTPFTGDRIYPCSGGDQVISINTTYSSYTYTSSACTCVPKVESGETVLTGRVSMIANHENTNDMIYEGSALGTNGEGISGYIWYRLTQAACPCFDETTKTYDDMDEPVASGVSCIEQDVPLSGYVPCSSVTTYWDNIANTCVTESSTTPELREIVVHVSANPFGGTRILSGITDRVFYQITQESCTDCNETTYEYEDTAEHYLGEFTCIAQTTSITVDVNYVKRTSYIDPNDGLCKEGVPIPGVSSVTITVYITANTSDHDITQNGVTEHVRWRYTQKTCSDCEGTSYEYGQSSVDVFTKTINCDAQNVDISGDISYTATTKTFNILDGSCTSSQTQGLSAVTSTVHIDANSTHESIVRSGIKDLIRYEITQEACVPPCDTGTTYTYDYSTVQPFTITITCQEQDVPVTGSVAYTASTTILDQQWNCVTTETTGTSGVTGVNTVHFAENTGYQTITKTGSVRYDSSHYISYTITQPSCHEPCPTSVTYDYTSVTTSTTATCFAQDVTFNAQIPYTATTTHEDCSTSTATGTSGVTETVHIPKNESESVTARTGTAGYIHYTINQQPCDACEGTDYTYSDVTKTVSATCLAQTVSIEADVPYTAITYEYVGDVCTSTTSTGTSAITISVDITKNETSEVVPWTGFEDYIYYTINQQPCKDDDSGWFTTEALSDGRFDFIIRPNEDYQDETISYSRDGGITWVDNEVWTLGDYTTVSLDVVRGDKIYWKGTVHVYGRDQSYGDIEACSQFSGTCDYKIYGNMMSLIYGDDYQGEHPDFTGHPYAFAYLFRDKYDDEHPDGHLKSANYLYLPSLDISEGCYQGLFYYCSGLTAVSKDLLPSDRLKEYCYAQMFAGCSSLKVAPVLPAEHLTGAFNLDEGCYNEMFSGCSSLNYIQFHALDNIVCVHDYDALYTLDWVNGVASEGVFCIQTGAGIYENQGTWHGNYNNAIPSGWVVTFIASEEDYFITTPIDDITNFFLTIGSNVGTGNVRSISYSTDSGNTWVTSANTGSGGLTVVVNNVGVGDEVWWYGEGLRFAIGLDDPNYYSRFHTNDQKRFVARGNIMKLLKGPSASVNTTIEGNSAFYKFFSSTNIFDATQLILPSTELTESCYEYMFKGCTYLKTGGPSVLPATVVPTQAYHGMYEGCSSMLYPSLPLMKISATTAGYQSLATMFSGCTAMDAYGANIELDCQTTDNQTFMGMFQACTSLYHTGERLYLKSNSLTQEAYYSMFDSCTALISTPPISAETASYMDCEAFKNLMRDCTSLVYWKYYSKVLAPETGITNHWYGNLQQEGYFIVRNDTTWVPEDYRFGYISPYVSDAGVPKKATIDDDFWTIERRGDIDWQWP